MDAPEYVVISLLIELRNSKIQIIPLVSDCGKEGVKELRARMPLTTAVVAIVQ